MKRAEIRTMPDPFAAITDVPPDILEGVRIVPDIRVARTK
jgi:hypothetical protein